MKFQSWLDGSTITHTEIGRWTDPSRSDGASVSIVILRGDYGLKRQSDSSRVLRMLIAASLAWGYPQASGLVLDISGLNYTGGDSLLSWTELLDERSGSPRLRISLYCNEVNGIHVQSLLDEEDENERMKVVHSLEDALRFATPQLP